jgi:predicted dehydrogenase
MDRLRLATIGVGWAGTRQVQAVCYLDRTVAVACLVDIDPEHLRTSTQELGISRTYTNYEDTFVDSAIDAVSICTLTHSIAK